MSELSPDGLSDPRNLIVNYIPTPVTDAELRTLFARFGDIESARVILDKTTGHPKGYGFVKYMEPESAQKAIEEMNGFEVQNKRLKVTPAKGPQSAQINQFAKHAQAVQQVLQQPQQQQQQLPQLPVPTMPFGQMPMAMPMMTPFPYPYMQSPQYVMTPNGIAPVLIMAPPMMPMSMPPQQQTAQAQPDQLPLFAPQTFQRAMDPMFADSFNLTVTSGLTSPQASVDGAINSKSSGPSQRQ